MPYNKIKSFKALHFDDRNIVIWYTSNVFQICPALFVVRSLQITRTLIRFYHYYVFIGEKGVQIFDYSLIWVPIFLVLWTYRLIENLTSPVYHTCAKIYLFYCIVFLVPKECWVLDITAHRCLLMYTRYIIIRVLIIMPVFNSNACTVFHQSVVASYFWQEEVLFLLEWHDFVYKFIRFAI